MSARSHKIFRLSEVEEAALNELRQEIEAPDASAALREMMAILARDLMLRGTDDAVVLPAYVGALDRDGVLGAFVTWCRARRGDPGYFLSDGGDGYVIPEHLDPASPRWDYAREQGVSIAEYLRRERQEQREAMSRGITTSMTWKVTQPETPAESD